MEIINKFKLVLALVLPVIILVLIRSLGVDHFKSDLKKWAEPSITRSNMITVDQTGALPGNKLIISLDKSDAGIYAISGEAQIIPSDSILDKKYLNTIRKHRGPVLLYSAGTAVSARIWMILSQMGCKNIYILNNNANIEVLNNKFRPDSAIRPEL
jgi:hypothetical protein